MKILFIIALTVISSLFSLETSRAELSLDAPPEVFLGENFSVKLHYSSSDNLDVKITVQDNSSVIFSEIYNLGWKSSFYYLVEAFPKNSEFILRATKREGKFDLCARLRKGKQILKDKFCKPIIVGNKSLNSSSASASDSPSAQANDSESKISPQNQTSLEINKREYNLSLRKASSGKIASNTSFPITSSFINEIHLKPKSSSDQPLFYTTEHKKYFYFLVAFTALLLVILTALFRREAKFKRANPY